MGNWICHLSRKGRQYRVTIPVGLIKDMGWEDVRLVLVGPLGEKTLKITRLIANGEINIQDSKD